ncbi:MAG: NUDIX domain-containing protein [bacterium]|nr:NUDIX domain-containing protein [bacterium]
MEPLQDIREGRTVAQMPIHGNKSLVISPSMTVHVVLMHPHNPTKIYWVLNKQEPLTAYHFSKTPKPRGWGNPGGGLEIMDVHDLTGRERSSDQMVQTCAQREVIAETGFMNFNFEYAAPLNSIFLRYTCPSGHQVITLAAFLQNFQQVEIEEVEEIEDGAWFDLSISPVELFQRRPDLPYWSHVRRTIMILNRIAQSQGKPLPPIHPTWNMVFPSDKGNLRISFQHSLPSTLWYEQLKRTIRNMAETHEDIGTPVVPGKAFEARRKQDEDEWRRFAESL